jgi:pyrimidine oxygenase
MGLWRDLDHTGRYAFAEEWLTLLKRLWTEERVNHKGWSRASLTLTCWLKST